MKINNKNNNNNKHNNKQYNYQIKKNNINKYLYR